MIDPIVKHVTAFSGDRLLISGPVAEVALAMKAAMAGSAPQPIVAFDDDTGRAVDFDLRGTEAEVVARLLPLPEAHPAPLERQAETPTEGRARGRPKLGVIGREVTLLPRQWEWLSAQPGGASVALRKLVDEARRTGKDAQKIRVARERAYHFMSAMAGNLPGFEEAARVLFSDDPARLEQQTSDWPADVRAYSLRLAFDGSRSDWG